MVKSGGCGFKSRQMKSQRFLSYSRAVSHFLTRGGVGQIREEVVRGGSFNFQLPVGGGSSYFITGISTHLSVNLQVERH